MQDWEEVWVGSGIVKSLIKNLPVIISQISECKCKIQTWCLLTDMTNEEEDKSWQKYFLNRSPVNDVMVIVSTYVYTVDLYRYTFIVIIY